MKKRYVISGLAGLLCLLTAMGIMWQSAALRDASATVASVAPAYKNVSSDSERTVYKIDARYDDTSKTVTGHMRVLVPNGSETPWERLVFHVYPNVFREWEFSDAAAPQSEGGINVTDVTVGGLAADAKVDHTIMEIALPEPLAAGQKTEVGMAFTLQLPEGGMRLNHTGQTAFLAQWYPMLAVYGQEGWHRDPYTETGDPFFTEMADFHVSLNVPKGYEVISTADDSKYKKQKTTTLSQRNVRDFAVVITKDYKSKSGKVGDTDVHLWYTDKMHDVADEMLAAAENGLAFFNETFGSYPYPEIDVVLGESGHGIAGMEYPGLVTSIDRVVTREGEAPATQVVAHELAHQWWYGLVGSNQVKEPWLDEGLTTFSESLYMREVEGEDERAWFRQVKDKSDEIHEKKGLTVVERLYDYPEQLYALMVYARPAAMMWDLVEKIGQDRVMEILRTYFERYQYRIATTEDFIQVASDVSGEDLRPFFDKWLYFREAD